MSKQPRASESWRLIAKEMKANLSGQQVRTAFAKVEIG
jgi:hypothetical protein